MCLLGVLEALAAISNYIPSVRKPARRPSLPARLAWTGLIVILYLIMSEIPLLGVPITGAQTSPTLASILLGMTTGSLMTLGIGPIVTAGIVLEVLVGGGLLKLDLTKPRDRRLFMGAQRTLALLFAAFEASMYALGCTFWVPALGGSITACPATPMQRVGVVVQLVLVTMLLLWFDELSRKGWGLGSALSLFIVANVAMGMYWEIGGPILAPGPANTQQYYGVLAEAILNGNWAGVVLRKGLPDLIGLIMTFVIIAVLVYLQLMRVYIPIASPRMGTIRSRIPLQFLYVTNIPILFVAIFVADIQVFAGIAAALGGPANPIAQALHMLATYMTPPRGLLNVVSEPLRALTSAIAWITLSIVFGFIWVEVAGLSPEKQAENIVKSGLQIPGIRRSTRLLAKLLERYIYSLTLISSIIVGVIAVTADFFGAYGSGSGLVLTVGIVYNFYLTLAYERTLEMYPVLRRLIS